MDGRTHRTLLDGNLLEFTEGRPLPLVAADQRYFMTALANDTVRVGGLLKGWGWGKGAWFPFVLGKGGRDGGGRLSFPFLD